REIAAELPEHRARHPEINSQLCTQVRDTAAFGQRGEDSRLERGLMVASLGEVPLEGELAHSLADADMRMLVRMEQTVEDLTHLRRRPRLAARGDIVFCHAVADSRGDNLALTVEQMAAGIQIVQLAPVLEVQARGIRRHAVAALVFSGEACEIERFL